MSSCSIEINPEKILWPENKHGLVDENGFDRKLMEYISLVLSPTMEQTTFLENINISDLFLALSSNQRFIPDKLRSTLDLAKHKAYWPWVLFLRTYLNQSYRLIYRERQISLDTKIRLTKDSTDELLILRVHTTSSAIDVSYSRSDQVNEHRYSSTYPAHILELENIFHKNPLVQEPIWTILTNEWTRRLSRYRATLHRLGSVACGSCKIISCCRPKYLKILDLVAFRIQHGFIPLPVHHDPSQCCYIGKNGCELLPGPLPATCISFHCDELISRQSKEMKDDLQKYADSANQIGFLFSFLWKLIINPPQELGFLDWNIGYSQFIHQSRGRVKNG